MKLTRAGRCYDYYELNQPGFTIENTAITLAAGHSSRLGRFKPLLEIDGQTLIQRTIAVFRQNRINDIIVVTGHRAADLEGVLAQEGVRSAHNKFYDQGMFSSVKAGMRRLPDHCEAFFVLPVDVAFVQEATISALIFLNPFEQRHFNFLYISSSSSE